jgi:signal transduction histidine kinase
VTEVTSCTRALDGAHAGADSANMTESTAAPVQSPRKSKLLLLAAVLTWCAVVASEWVGISGWTRLGFGTAAVAFLVSFVWEVRREGAGWSVPLCCLVASSGAAVALGGFGLTPALYVIAGVHLYEKLPRTPFWIVVALLNALLLARLLSSASAYWALSAFAAYAGFQLFGLMMVSVAQALDTANRQLRSANAELLSTRALLTESARAQERLSLSRELHDVCGHKLTALKITLRPRPDQTALSPQDWALCQTLTDELLGDIRSVVAQLRDHEGIDLAAALHKLGQGWHAPLVEVQLGADVRVPSMVHAATLLRVAQEGLTNAARHAHATRVEIRLEREGDALLLSISDNGKGDAVLTRGNGLNGMAERLAELGGTLQISALQPGLRLTAQLPVEDGASA